MASGVLAILILVLIFKSSPTFAIPFFDVLPLLIALTTLGLVHGSPFGVVPGAGDNVLPLNNTGFLIAYKPILPLVLAGPVTFGGVLQEPLPPLSILMVVAIGLDMT